MNLRTLLPVILLLLVAGCHGSSTDEQGANRLLASGMGLADLGNYKLARDSVSEALEAYQRLGQETSSADAERLLGSFDEAEGNLDSALAHYGRALQGYRGQANREPSQTMILTMVNLYRTMGDTRAAYAQCEEALRLAGVIGDKEGTLRYSRALLPLLRDMRRDDAFVTMWKGLMDAADSSANVAAQADLRDEAGLQALARGDAVTAARRFSEALAIAGRPADSLKALFIKLHLAQALDAAGNLPDAMTTYTEALRMADAFSGGRPIREELLLEVGNTLLRLRRSDDAVRFYQAALSSAGERYDVRSQVYALLQLAHCMLPHRPDSSITLARQALELLANGAPPWMEAYAHGTLGLSLLKATKPVEALEQFRTAVEAADISSGRRDEDPFVRCEQSAMGAGRTPWHDETIDLLLRLGRRDDALGYALRKHHTLFLDALGSMRLTSSSDELNALLGAWHGVHARMAGEEAALSKAMATLAGQQEAAPAVWSRLQKERIAAAQVSASILAQRPELSPFVWVPAADGGMLQRRLPSGSTLLFFGTTSRNLYSFVVNREAVTAPVVAMERATLARQCAAYASTLEVLATAIDSQATQKNPKNDQKQAAGNSALSETFFRPVERFLSGTRQVLIVPPDQLPFIPLHALRSGQGQSLLERWPVAYVVPGLLSGELDAGPLVKDIVAFGNPGETRRDVDYELRDIRVNYKDARFYVDAAAVLPALVKEHADLVHAGLDIRWDNERADNAEIMLPDPRTEVVKGIPAGELLRIPPFRAMVVYNCSLDPATAATQFCTVPFASGCRTLIVNALATGRKTDKAFAEAFYAALQAGGTPAEAYRTASLDLMRRREVTIPLWASYVLWRR